MTSDAQIEANRRNAVASTGPRTPEGKARSRGNALKHGLSAELLAAEGAEARSFEALRAELFALHAPGCRVEVALVDRLAQLLWRLRRSALVEAGLLAEAERFAAAARAAGQAGRTGEMVDAAFQRNVGTADALVKVARYEGRIERAYAQTRELLRRVQEDRRNVLRHVREGGRLGVWVHDDLVQAPDAEG